MGRGKKDLETDKEIIENDILTHNYNSTEKYNISENRKVRLIELKTAFRFTPTCFTCQNRRGSEVPPIRK